MNDKIIYLKDRKYICKNTIGIWFEKRDTEYDFIAGQYAEITLLDKIYSDKDGDARLFSIASAPGKNELMFATRAFDTAFNKNIMELPLGSRAKISEPGGNTPLHTDASKTAVFLIGGIGITPVRSMVEHIMAQNLPYKVYLFQSNPDKESMAFFDEFDKWSKENKNIKYIPAIDDINDNEWKFEKGYLSEDMIKKYLPEFGGSIFYIVGPTVLVDKMESILKKNNVPQENIKLERFG
ncbi:MAG TPA: FAD-dependent oxidoreductase [Ignavibacteria bacterium]|nr:FAD-dependent oxidoreductase [Ignavibacteria bacterium]